MPLTSDQLDNWFTYHAPTEETAPKYAAINAAKDLFVNEVVAAMTTEGLALDRFDKINKAARMYVETICLVVPDCVDRAAAIRCVRLARYAANEAIAQAGNEILGKHLAQVFAQNVLASRWQANSAIACGGK